MEAIDIDMNKTSWTNEQLEKLSDPNNHKIIYDGFEFWWYHKINDNNWDLHYIEGFEDYKKPYSFLKTWIYKWTKELSERKLEAAKLSLRGLNKHLKDMQKVVEISKSDGIKTKEKIRLINEIIPGMSITDLAKALNISRQVIHRHLKNEN